MEDKIELEYMSDVERLTRVKVFANLAERVTNLFGGVGREMYNVERDLEKLQRFADDPLFTELYDLLLSYRDISSQLYHFVRKVEGGSEKSSRDILFGEDEIPF